MKHEAHLRHRYGTADELELGEMPEPQAGEDGEVVVKVAAAALNFFDTLLIAGKYQVDAGLSIFAGAPNLPERFTASARA